jgi:hypothetical protein
VTYFFSKATNLSAWIKTYPKINSRYFHFYSLVKKRYFHNYFFSLQISIPDGHNHQTHTPTHNLPLMQDFCFIFQLLLLQNIASSPLPKIITKKIKSKPPKKFGPDFTVKQTKNSVNNCQQELNLAKTKKILAAKILSIDFYLAEFSFSKSSCLALMKTNIPHIFSIHVQPTTKTQPFQMFT